MPWSPVFVLGYSKRRFLKIVQMTMKTIHLMPCRNPYTLYIHLAFTYSVGPSLHAEGSSDGPLCSRTTASTANLRLSVSDRCPTLLQSRATKLCCNKNKQFTQQQIPHTTMGTSLKTAALYFNSVVYTSNYKP